jgi:hypothetical protein
MSFAGFKTMGPRCGCVPSSTCCPGTRLEKGSPVHLAVSFQGPATGCCQPFEFDGTITGNDPFLTVSGSFMAAFTDFSNAPGPIGSCVLAPGGDFLMDFVWQCDSFPLGGFQRLGCAHFGALKSGNTYFLPRGDDPVFGLLWSDAFARGTGPNTVLCTIPGSYLCGNGLVSCEPLHVVLTAILSHFEDVSFGSCCGQLTGNDPHGPNRLIVEITQ